MVDAKYINLLKYSTARNIIIKDTLCCSILYYLVVLGAIGFIGFVMVDEDRYLYKRESICSVETRASGHATGTIDGCTKDCAVQYYDGGDLIYPNSGDTSSMFVATQIVSTEKQVQEYCKLRPCKANTDCNFSTSSRDSGVTGEPLKTKVCNTAIGYCNDFSWCPTMKMSNKTFNINDFSNMKVNVVAHGETFLKNGDSKRVYTNAMNLRNATGIVFNMTALLGNLTIVQKYGALKDVYIEFECSRDDAENTKCDVETEIKSEKINESLIPNSSNQTIKQGYTYDYQIGGQDMRDEFQATGVYINFRCVFKIKEVDIINIVYCIGFVFVCMILIHMAFEVLLRFNPFMNTENSERLDDAKFDMIQEQLYMDDSDES